MINRNLLIKIQKEFTKKNKKKLALILILFVNTRKLFMVYQVINERVLLDIF